MAKTVTDYLGKAHNQKWGKEAPKYGIKNAQDILRNPLFLWGSPHSLRTALPVTHPRQLGHEHAQLY